MSIELPVLRLGLAGFTAEQQQHLGRVLADAPSGGMSWQVARFDEADAWWVCGSRTQLLADQTLRVASGVPSGRSIHLSPPDIDRPLAFSMPLAARQFEPRYHFDTASLDSMHAVLAKFEAWLRPMTAQFCLASQVIEQESVLVSGIYHVTSSGVLVAVVNLQGEVGVLPTAEPADFENAMWSRRPSNDRDIPENFVRTSLSQLMWHFAVRTSRDVLPKRYYNGLIFFRRPPRLPQRLLRDTHLLLMRELANTPATFQELQTRTGMAQASLAEVLGALYLVGAITGNPKRAGLTFMRPEAPDAANHEHSAPSGMDADADSSGRRKGPQFSDRTVPAPMSLE